MKSSKRLSVNLFTIFFATLNFNYTPDAQAVESLNTLSCQQLKMQLTAISDKMQRSLDIGSLGGVNNNASLGEVIWGGLVGQQIKKVNGSVSDRAGQLKRAHSQKCSN